MSDGSGGGYEVITYLLWFDGSGTTLDLHSHDRTTRLRFGIRAGFAYLGCRDPVVLKGGHLVVLRCGGWIMAMDPVERKVGRLVRGDSFVLIDPAFGPPTGSRATERAS